MEIPLVLTSPEPDKLVYSLPIWFRIVIGIILAVVLFALATGERPGFFAWFVVAVLVVGGLYEDKWTFDAANGHVVHRAGLLISARTTMIEFASIASFCLVPLVKGTIPGSKDEKMEKEAALSGGRSDDSTITRFRHKKPFLNLELEHKDGTRYLIEHLPARRVQALRSIATQMATLCEKPLVEG